MSKYETVIGLEIHAELATQTKLFCSCKNDPFRAPEPNLYICPVCLALPGTLPVMNRQAVEWAALVGLAVGCEIGFPVKSKQQRVKSGAEDPSLFTLHPSLTKWDRKNYFYPDLPKGYQISQYDLPIDHTGKLIVAGKEIEITRIHLEEDTGKLIHPDGADYSLIDYNRASVPLLELVTEPVIHSAEEAAGFAQLYQLVLRTLGVSNADMEKGEMRVEANISVRPAGTTEFGTKVEVKNLNSFKIVEKAIAYETERQIALIERGEKVVQETRGWHEARAETYSQRSKETAAEYRYFPEPDLPPVTLTKLSDNSQTSALQSEHKPAGIDLNRLAAQVPELPWQKEARYTALGLPSHDSQRLVYDRERSRYFDEATGDHPEHARLIANWILNEVPDTSIATSHLLELADLISSGTITTKLVKDLLAKIRSTGASPRAIVEREGLQVVRDTGAITSMIQAVLADHPQAVVDYRAGKVQSLGFLVGKVMAKSRGQADPALVKTAIEAHLREDE